MKISSDVLYKTAQIILSRIVPALSVLVVLFALFCLGLICISTYGCHSEPPKPEEIELSDYDYGSAHCPFTGNILRIEDVIGSKEVNGGSGLVVALVQPDDPGVTGVYVAAVASKHANFSVGDRIEVCQVRVLTIHRVQNEYGMLFTARKLPDTGKLTSVLPNNQLSTEGRKP